VATGRGRRQHLSVSCCQYRGCLGFVQGWQYFANLKAGLMVSDSALQLYNHCLKRGTLLYTCIARCDLEFELHAF
jgi:hypothetical protein